MKFVIFSSENPISDAHFTAFLDLMHEAFPVSERRTDEEFSSMRTDPRVQFLCALSDDGELLGSLLYWLLDDFIFMENLATRPTVRNQGLGAAILQALNTQFDTLRILEVEPPEDELTRRRVGFYTRNGFLLNAYAYLLPCLSDETEHSVPLLIMSNPTALTQTQFEAIRDTVYATVYTGKPIRK